MLSAALCRLLTSCPVIEPPPACEYLCSSTFLPQYHPLCSKTLSSYNWRLPNYKGTKKLWDRCSSIRVTAPWYLCYWAFCIKHIFLFWTSSLQDVNREKKTPEKHLSFLGISGIVLFSETKFMCPLRYERVSWIVHQRSYSIEPTGAVLHVLKEDLGC
jgi:hypothetical protein